MPWSESLPQFSLAGTLLTVLLLFFAAVGEPFLGRRAFSWLSRRRDGDKRALGLLYAVTMAIHLLWGLLVLGVLLLSPELNLVDLGLRTPDAWGPIAGGAIGGLIALAAFWVLVNGLPTKERLPVLGKLPGRRPGDGGKGRRGQGHRGRRVADKPMTLPEPGRQQYLLLPRTGRERGLAAGMAVTGGVFGELLYRGLFITLIASMGVPLWIAAVLSIVLFSVAHAYQGWWGLLSAGFSGTLFTVLYLGTGSLIVPILVHVALNLRSVVFPPAEDREAALEERGYQDDDDDYYGDDYYEDDEYGGQYDDGRYGDTGEFEPVEASGPQGPPPGPPGPLPGPVPSGGPVPPGAPQGPPPGSQGPPPGYQGPPPGYPQGPPPGPPANMYPDEWIDRQHGPEGDTPGPGYPYRD
ncbi:CPBP family intramembrane glutamic endopeptidase [Nocardiopsis oceani]